MENCGEENVLKIGQILNDKTCSLAERFRALFTLRGIGGKTSINEISRCLMDNNTSPLLKHECAYCLGQLKDTYALSVLETVLSDTNQESMVRHEAGEALGAIGDPIILPVLQKFVDDISNEVAETCQIAIDKLLWLQENTSFVDNNPYASIDPAPPTHEGNIDKWTMQLCNSSVPLFDRYRALFALRNMGGVKAVQALAKGLSDSSVLFKHEIAYVLGQMQDPSSVQYLAEKLQDLSESPMVRHECAEALGSIATPKCLEILHQFTHDNEEVVRESCIVALDMYTYQHSNDFQYADTLKIVT